MNARKTTAIVADYYRIAVQNLVNDPILGAMAREIPDGFDLETHEFMMGALREYRTRGGEVETHIGGPAEAIRQYLTAHTLR